MPTSLSMENAKFTYQHYQKCLNQPVDTHHIVVRKSGRRVLVIFFTALIFSGLLLVVSAKERSSGLLLWSSFIGRFATDGIAVETHQERICPYYAGFWCST